MKYLIVLFVLFIEGLTAKAEISYAPGNLTVYISKSMPGYTLDPSSEIPSNGYATYNLEGEIFDTPVDMNKGVVSITDSSANPIMAIKKLMTIFQSQDIASLQKCYDPSAASAIAGIMKNPDAIANWIKEAKKVTNCRLECMFNRPNDILAFVRYGADKQTQVVTPFVVKKVDDAYFLTPGDISEKKYSNILLFLMKNPATDLTKPPITN